MVLTTLRLAYVSVIITGLGPTAHKLFAVLTVGHMVDVTKENVNVMLDGQVIDVTYCLVILAAQNMGSARMEHVYALRDGMVDIVHYLVAKALVIVMVHVLWKMENIDVCAQMDGLAMTAVSD